MDDHGALIGQGRADGIGASVGFVPERTRAQGHAVRAIDEFGVAQAVQQQTTGIRQHDQVATAAHLVEHELHDGAGMGQELMLTPQRLTQVLPTAQRLFIGQIHGAQARALAALP